MADETKIAAGFVLGAITVILISIFRKGSRIPPGRHDIEFSFPDDQKIKIIGVNDYMAELKEGQSMNAKANPKTRNGHPAAIEPGSARWTSSDESVVTVTPDPDDELKAKIEGVDGSNNESVVVEFRADGNRGEGVREIVISGAVTCTQGDAVVGDMEFDTPVDVETTEGGDVNGGGDSGSGAGGEANQGVDENPSAGAGGSDASGTTDPSDSNQPADQGGDVPTVQEAGEDTAERNSDSADRVPGES